MLNPFNVVLLGGLKEGAFLGFLSMLNSEPSQVMRKYLFLYFSKGKWELNCLSR